MTLTIGFNLALTLALVVMCIGAWREDRAERKAGHIRRILGGRAEWR